MHPSQEKLLKFFEFSHLPEGRARDTSARCAALAHEMAAELAGTESGEELTTGLRKLLEAKDCFVRAALRA